MKIYISGRITGKENYATDFNTAETLLKGVGYHPVNPIKLNHENNHTWEQNMVTDIEALFSCEAIYMLPDWNKSKGASIEHAIAVILDKKIIYQSLLNF